MFIANYHHRIYQSGQKKSKKQFQKEQVKKGYAENYRREMYEKVKETSKRSVQKAAEAVKEFARKHAKAGAGILAVLLLFVYILSSVTSCSLMVGEAVLLAISGSYLSEPEEIEEAELSFMRMEMELENEINDVETDYPDYDEYRYDIGPIGHDPFVLVGYLSAVYQEFTYADVADELESLFDAVYTLSLVPSTETRTRMETRTRTETRIRYETRTRTETRTGVRIVLDEDGIARPEIYTYEVK